MFTKIRLKNFRSFGDVVFNLEKEKRGHKPVALIYGENGMGKTNLICGIAALVDLMRTMDLRERLDQLLNDEKFLQISELTGSSTQDLQSLLGYRDVKILAKEFRMVGSTDPVSLEYEFVIGGKQGKYQVQLGMEEIIYEKLEFTLDKRRGTYYELTPSEKKLSLQAFCNREIIRDIKEQLSRFWGKHSLLAILLHEIHDKSEQYIAEGLSAHFRTLMQAFCGISCITKRGTGEQQLRSGSIPMLPDLERGVVSQSQQDLLWKTEKILSAYLSAINSDNRHAYYETTTSESGQIRYRLFVSKMISGKVRDIDFSLESNGNHNLLDLLSCFLYSMSGGVVIIDEIDSGIHDLLMKKIMEEAAPYITGQLIVTVHNTSLMEVKSLRTSVYIISENDKAEKFIKCIDDYPERTYQVNNVRKKYMNGEYEGIPEVGSINFQNLLQILNRK